MSIVAVGIGAGLVSALLFGVVITGSLLGIVLSIVAPMPIFIAALGWQHRAGLVAAVVGGAAMALALSPTAGLTYALAWALPGWWLSYLALLGRPTADGTVEWYPLGRITLWIAATATVIAVVAVVAFGAGSYEVYRSNLQQAYEAFVRSQAQPEAGTPSFFIEAFPLILSAFFVFVFALNLWLAAKTVQISGRLPRPWPFVPGTALPRIAIGILAAGIAASFLGGFLGAFGLALFGALLAAFALHGLAFVHDTSRQRPARGFLLSGIYTLAILLSSIAVPLLALIGLADVALSLRNRFGPGGPGPRTPPT